MLLNNYDYMMSLFLFWFYLSFQPHELSLQSPKNSPPRLLIVDRESAPEGFIVADGVAVPTKGGVQSQMVDLMSAYYAWDLTYPRTYQILGFFQVYLLGDDKNQFHRSAAMTKFEKMYLEV